jgi:hypothetical protein
LPEKCAIAPPPLFGVMKLSCFSAVDPVSGWNQCVKWVAPRSTAHSFMARAIVSAMVRSSGLSFSMVARIDW